jgi:3-oxoacyl-[acyl-carrier protein] reductase
MDLGLRGLRAIGTGGTKGIGRRAADMLADEGCNVSVCARNEAEVKAAVVTPINAPPKVRMPVGSSSA